MSYRNTYIFFEKLKKGRKGEKEKRRKGKKRKENRRENKREKKKSRTSPFLLLFIYLSFPPSYSSSLSFDQRKRQTKKKGQAQHPQFQIYLIPSLFPPKLLNLLGKAPLFQQHPPPLLPRRSNPAEAGTYNSLVAEQDFAQLGQLGPADDEKLPQGFRFEQQLGHLLSAAQKLDEFFETAEFGDGDFVLDDGLADGECAFGDGEPAAGFDFGDGGGGVGFGGGFADLVLVVVGGLPAMVLDPVFHGVLTSVKDIIGDIVDQAKGVLEGWSVIVVKRERDHFGMVRRYYSAFNKVDRSSFGDRVGETVLAEL